MRVGGERGLARNGALGGRGDAGADLGRDWMEILLGGEDEKKGDCTSLSDAGMDAGRRGQSWAGAYTHSGWGVKWLICPQEQRQTSWGRGVRRRKQNAGLELSPPLGRGPGVFIRPGPGYGTPPCPCSRCTSGRWLAGQEQQNHTKGGRQTSTPMLLAIPHNKQAKALTSDAVVSAPAFSPSRDSVFIPTRFCIAALHKSPFFRPIAPPPIVFFPQEGRQWHSCSTVQLSLPSASFALVPHECDLCRVNSIAPRGSGCSSFGSPHIRARTYQPSPPPPSLSFPPSSLLPPPPLSIRSQRKTTQCPRRNCRSSQWKVLKVNMSSPGIVEAL
ncbi:hypothetical protein B0O80DRAFT_230356 [Mortierella sp. GBAus27b]|nr:hypothetical protein B0O80DRAFT_230356 [Mortierella sp. GBAus27b]